MKRVITLFVLIILFSVFAYAATTTFEPYSHYMLGYVDSAVEFSVTIDESVLPFDLEGSPADYDSTWNSYIRGLQIGTYSLVANTAFNLTIEHTKLILTGSDGETNNNSIDYVLYVVERFNPGVYYKCFNSNSSNNPNSTPNKITISRAANASGICEIINQGLFVMLYAPNNSYISALNSGSYESTITFKLETT